MVKRFGAHLRGSLTARAAARRGATGRGGAHATVTVALVALAVALAAATGAPRRVLAAPAGRAGLPRLASTVQPAPEPTQAQELEQALAQVASAKVDEQQAGLARLKDGGAGLVPAMARKLAELRKTANRETIAVLVTEARKGRAKKGDDDERPRKKKGASGDRGKGAEPEKKGDDAEGWLPLVLARPKPGDAAYRDLVAVLAIERALVDVGTTAAAREIVNVFVYFGDLFRIDAQHAVGRLGDRAVPALLEARKHDVEKVRRWASRQLDAIGKAVPGETVQIADPEVVADVLRAYGRTKDIDALRVIVSFTSSDRVHVREAAREALVSYGEAALWQLREAHESTTGKRPPPGHPWDQLARELFEAHDRARLEEIIGIFDDGLAKQREGKFDEMAQAFDSVLARSPAFERRAEMVDGYFELARRLAERDRPRALVYARKALRLDPAGPNAKTIEGHVLALEGDDVVARGVTDIALYRKSLEVDPSNDRARQALARLERREQAHPEGGARYLAAAAIGLISVIASFVVGTFRRQAPSALRPTASTASPNDGPRPPDEGPLEAAGSSDEPPTPGDHDAPSAPELTSPGGASEGQ